MGQNGGPKMPVDGLNTSYDFGNISSYNVAGSLKDIISGINLTLNNTPTISGILSSIIATFNGTTQTATSASVFGSSGAYARTLMAWIKPSSVANSAILSLGADTQGTTVMATGQWYFMCATNAGGSASKTYLNGVLEASSSIYTPDTSNTILTIGASGRPVSINNFTGDISQAKLFLRELSAAEILQAYNAQKSRYGL